MFRYFDIQIALTDPFRRSSKHADGARQSFGEPETKPDRRCNDEDREAEIDQRVKRDDLAPARIKLSLLTDRLVCALNNFQHVTIQ